MNRNPIATQEFQTVVSMVYRILFEVFLQVINNSSKPCKPALARSRQGQSAGIIVVLSLIGLIASPPATAQITPDATLGSESSRVTRNVMVRGQNADRIDGGSGRGANLFHSFTDFNVNDGQRVYFANPAGVTNILSRVTGNTRSDIMGTLGVDGSANLFLINPNGIIFGPNAQLDVSGSFTASTANSFTFPDGSEFSATNPGDSSLLSVAVPLGVQYGASAAIANAGNLTVGQNLQLSGGRVTSTGQLAAPNGQLLVEGEAGDVQVRQVIAQTTTLSASNDLVLYSNNLGQNSTLTAGRDIVVRSPDLSIGGELNAGNDLTLEAQNRVELLDSSSLIAGRDIVVRSPNLLSIEGGKLYARNDLTLEAQNRIEVLNSSSLVARRDIVVRSPDLSIGGELNAGNDLTLEAQNRVELLGSSSLIAGRDIVVRSPIRDLANGSPYIVGGYFITQESNGAIVDFLIPHQRVILTSGDVTLNSPYSSLPLYILAGGKVQTGDVEINESENTTSTFNIPNGQGGTQTISVQANNTPNLDIRSGNIRTGINWSQLQGIQIPGQIINLEDPNVNTSRVDVRITQRTLESSIQAGNIVTSVPSGSAGSVNLEARSNIITGNIGSYVRGEGQDLTPRARYVPNAPNTTGQVQGSSATSMVSYGNAGDVTITSSGNIITSSIDASLGQNIRGVAGNIVLRGDNVTPTPGSRIAGITSGFGNAGSITVYARNDIRLDNVAIESNAEGQGFSPGNINIDAGNNIVLTNDSQISTIVGRGGRGEQGRGNIIITTNQLTLNNHSQINSFLNDLNGDGLPPQGRAGNITVTLLNNSSDGLTSHIRIRGSSDPNGNPTGIFSTVGNGTIHRSGLGDATGTGGTITLNLGAGGLTIGDNYGSNDADAGIAAKTFAIGNAGDVIITGNGSVIIQNGGFLDNSTDSRGSTSGTPRIGNAGAINVTANSISLRNDSPVRRAIQSSAQTPNSPSDPSVRGSGGPINITANSLTINNAAISSETDGANRSYRGGDINITAPTIALSSNRSNSQGQIDGITAATTGGSQAGSISIATRRLTIDDNAQVNAGTSSRGAGGSISLQPYENERSLTVNFEDRARISADSRGAGNGGSITARAPEAITLRGNGFLSARGLAFRNRRNQPTSGVAGSIAITTGRLSIQDGARVSVNSAGEAGTLEINANSIELDNARLTAIARSGSEGNININMSGTLFQLYNRSRVTAGAENKGNGGSVNIDASNGFVLTNPYGNSDILANASGGRGGDITITTNAIFGLEERELSPLSDINADSQFSTSGSITLNTLNIDPTRGLGELPVDLVDTSSLVADGCVGRNRSGVTDQGDLTRTGRGGLSPSPSDPLSNGATTPPLATLNPNETPSGSASVPDAPQVQSLIEAQGLRLNAEGKVSLVSGASTSTSPAVEQPAACSFTP